MSELGGCALSVASVNDWEISIPICLWIHPSIEPKPIVARETDKSKIHYY